MWLGHMWHKKNNLKNLAGKKANSRWPFNMCCNEKDMKALWKLGKLLHELIHTANLAEEGWCQLSYCTLPAESLHSVVKGRISNFCKRKKRVPMCCGVLRRSCETRKMIMNKGRNSLPAGPAPKPPNNKHSTALTNALSMLVAMVIVSSTL